LALYDLFEEIPKVTATFRQSGYYADARYLCGIDKLLVRTPFGAVGAFLLIFVLFASN